jgi:hypothetical protein
MRMRWWLRVGMGAGVVLMAAWGATARAQSGLLLGMADGCDNREQPCASRNRTLWIVPKGGTVQMTEIPDLIVPRRDGFWRVGVRTYCQLEDPDDADDDAGKDQPSGHAGEEKIYSIHDAWFAGAVDRQPAIDNLIPCPRHFAVGDACASDFSAIGYVTPEYVSIGEQEEGMCPGAAHPGAGEMGTVARLDDPQRTGIAFSEMEGAGASEAMREGAARARVKNEVGYPAEAAALENIKKKYPNWDRMTATQQLAVLDDADEESCGGDTDDQSWNFYRDRGRWAAHSEVDLPHVCGDYLPFDMPFRPPFSAPFTGPITLAAIREQVPDAYDAVWSPKKEMVVVLTGQFTHNKITGEETTVRTALLVFLPHGQVLGKPIATLQTGTSTGPVMAEWATGANVTRWTAELARIKAQGVVRPRLTNSTPPAGSGER